MPAGPAEFLKQFFGDLEAQGVRYVILHSYERLPEQISTDVDYAVRTSDLPKLAPLAHDLAKRLGWRVAHVIEPHIYSLYAVVVDPENLGCCLQLDACGHYVEKGCFFLSDEALLRDRAKVGDFYAPAPPAEFGYLLAKALSKGKPVTPVLPRLRGLAERDPAGCEARFAELCGESEGGLGDWLKKPDGEWEKLRTFAFRRNRFGLGDKLREGLRAVKRTVRPKGLHLALLGPEGQHTAEVLALAGPMLQGPIFRSLKVYQFGNASESAGWLRPSGRYLAVYISKVVPARIKNSLALFSSSPDDLVLTPERYGFRTGGWVPRLLRRLLPRADITIILAEPLQDGPGAESDQLRRRWRTAEALARNNPRYTIIPAHGSPAEVARLVYRAAIEVLAQREARQKCPQRSCPKPIS
jgi:hypothetical protein